MRRKRKQRTGPPPPSRVASSLPCFRVLLCFAVGLLMRSYSLSQSILVLATVYSCR
jgi:hypothetical protein